MEGNGKEKKSILKKAWVDTIPVLSGYVVLGFGFGMLMKAGGFSIAMTLAMSLLIYAGSMQYAAVGLMTGGASLFTVILTTLMVNGRHLFYGISMLEKYRNAGSAKPYLIFALTDETYSLVCGEVPGETREEKTEYCFLVSILDQSYWVTGSVLGAVAGSVLHFNSQGIDFALTALFLTVFLEQWISTRDHRASLIGVGASLLCLAVFGPSRFLVPAMLLITTLLLAGGREAKDE